MQPRGVSPWGVGDGVLSLFPARCAGGKEGIGDGFRGHGLTAEATGCRLLRRRGYTGLAQRQITTTGAEIDALVYALYGLTEEEIIA